jgi:UDP-N-acetyl-2-amino-2-deoxyglucuronate dehydrogenase
MFKCAIVGLGRGRELLEVIIKHEKADITAICDLNKSLADKVAKDIEKIKNKPCKIYTNFDEMIETEKLDCVFLATPHYLHAPHTIKAARKEIHVFVEKPMAMNLHECDQMITECREADVKLAVGLQYNFDAEVHYLANAARGAKGDKGSLGRITDIYIVARHYRSEMYYLSGSHVDPNTGVKSGRWRGRWDTEGGGLLPNQAIHNLDILRYITGPIKSLMAYGKNISPDHKFVEVEDTIVASMELESGALANLVLTTSNANTVEKNKIVIHGTKGCLIAEGGYGGFELSVDTRWDDEEDWDVPIEMLPHKRDQIHNFLWAIENDEDPLVTGEEGRKSVELMRAIYKSIMIEGPVRFPLVDMREQPFIHNVSREKNLEL